MDYIQSQQERDLDTDDNFDYKWEEINMDEHQWWFPDDWCISNLYSSSSPLLHVSLFLMLYFSKILQEFFEWNVSETIYNGSFLLLSPDELLPCLANNLSSLLSICQINISNLLVSPGELPLRSLAWREWNILIM